MRTVNIVLLLLAGALSGALLMRVAHRPLRVAMHPVAAPAPAPTEQAASSQTSPTETKPPEIAEVQTPSPAILPASPERKAEIKHPREKKPSPLRRVPDPVAISLSLRVLHAPPHRVEVQTPPASPAVPPSPPVLPEQPKETPPARMEPENVTPPSAPILSAPEPNQATLNAGMLIPVRLVDSLSSERSHAGDSFTATLYRELIASGFVIAERGARVEGRVTAADREARILS
ncbi:MAG: hypothetical protein WBY44_06090, partial [Bryobacteraceae bacterium]